MSKFQSIVSPKSVAVVGASDKLHKNSGRIVINLQKSDFSGEFYFINPKYNEILGTPCYSSILEINNEIDLVCIIVPSYKVANILRECVEKKVKSVIIICSGFSENGPEGRIMETELKEIIKGTNISVYGPNAPGFYHFINKWGISFSPRFEPKKFLSGSVGLISHGGSLGRAVLDANEKGVGFSYWFSPGNETDIDTNDCFEYLLKDPATKTIILIIESISDEERFFRLLHEAFLKHKPVILLPIGHSKLSRLAVTYHLGKNEDYKISWNLINHPGLIKVGTLDELVSIAWLFSTYNLRKGKRTAILSWAGATSIYLADLCIENGILLPPLSEILQKKLASIINLQKTLINPLDLTTAVYDDMRKLTCCLDLLENSGEFDNIIVPYPFQVDYQNEILSKHIKLLMNQDKCTYIPIFMSQGYKEELSIEILRSTKKPFFQHEFTAIKALSSYLNYSSWEEEKREENIGAGKNSMIFRVT